MHDFEDANWQPRSVKCNKCKRIFIKNERSQRFCLGCVRSQRDEKFGLAICGRCGNGFGRKASSQRYCSDGCRESTLVPSGVLDEVVQTFHLRSQGSRDLGRGAKPRLEGAHAMRRWLPRGHEIHAPMRLSQGAQLDLETLVCTRPELPAFTVRVAAHVSGSWK
jgi:hypothetical protein